ncbi:hypothetical protein GOBAR_DD28976 [Gossypium barbadense]|nr:hypothetical protein GOBAR_DD28976 [Gossypium barbadense]
MPTRSPQTQALVRPPWERPMFDPILISYTELFSIPVEKHLLVPTHKEPMQPPFPRWYDAHARCEYHSGNPGHTIDNCLALKYKLEIREGVKTNEINMLDAKPITIVYKKKIPIKKRVYLKDSKEGLANPLGFRKGPTRYLKTHFFPTQKNTSGLGYKPTREDVKTICKEQRAKRLARMAGKKVVEPPLICPPLSKTFYSVGFQNKERTPVKLMINRDAVHLNMIGDRVSMSRD